MQAKPFLVFALPRSRTLWLSNALTYGPAVCHHDLCVYGVAELERVITSGTCVGVADTGIIILLEQMRFQIYPAVAVHRDPAEVYASLRRLGVETTLESLTERAQKLRELERYWEGPVLHVEYEDVDRSGERIWNHCIGEGFDSQRWERLCDMKVEVFIDRELEKFRERKWLSHT